MESCHVRQKGKTVERCEIVETWLRSSLRVQEEKPNHGKTDNSEGKNLDLEDGKSIEMEVLLLGPLEVRSSPSN